MKEVSGTPFGYSDAVWRLFNEAPRAGAWADGQALTASAATPANRNVLRLQVKMDGARIVDARFQAYGCPTTIAVGAWLAEWVIGKPLQDLPAATAAQVRSSLEIPEERIHCALLGEDVVRSLLNRGGSVSVELTESAARRIQQQLKQRGQGLGLRLGVKKAGCSGYAYVLDYADAAGAGDVVFQAHGATVVIARDDLPLLQGLRVDYRREGLGEAFRFDNPNAKALCGCGESFHLEEKTEA